MDNAGLGSFAWIDLTVHDPEALVEFYGAVCGWTTTIQEMGEYEDFTMLNADGEPIAGICHRTGVKKNLPPMWLPYVRVPSLAEAVAAVEHRGGTVVEQRFSGSGTGFAVVRDPVGACLALWQSGPSV